VTLAYLAAWDVHHANLFDRVERTTGIVPFGRLLDQLPPQRQNRRAHRMAITDDDAQPHQAPPPPHRRRRGLNRPDSSENR